MAKNKITDLNDHLFAQLERLGDENISTSQLSMEVERGKAIAMIAKEIVNTGKLALDAQRKMDAGDIHSKPRMLETGPRIGLQ